MNCSALRHAKVFFSVLFVLLLFCVSPVSAADGKKWDGKKYPFKLFNSSKTNSKSNPFIIDTAGKLAYFSWLASRGDIVRIGQRNRLRGLKYAFQGNFVKLTANLNMNGSRFEFIPIADNAATFDGGGHVITNLRISDRTTKAFIDRDQAGAEIRLALFQSAGRVKNLSIGKGSSITYTGSFKAKLLKVYAAAIAAEAWEIDNCSSDATVIVKANRASKMAEIGESTVGGVVAKALKVTSSYNRGAIVFVGNVFNSKVKNRTGRNVPATLTVGGVCAEPGKEISGCYNTGSITVRASGDNVMIGGVASTLGKVIRKIKRVNLYNTGKVTFSATGNVRYAYIGGVLGYGITSPRLIGRPVKYIDSKPAFNKGAIRVNLKTGKHINVGGISGGTDETKRFSNSTVRFGGVYGFINTYNTAPVYVSSTGKVSMLNVGGIAGHGSMVFNSYNTGSISGNSGSGTKLNVGGIGGSSVYVQNSYSIGNVSGKGSGTKNIGGLLGLASVRWGETDNSLYSVLNGFWLRQPKARGINRYIKYAKGSYYYNTRNRKEDSFYGTVYSFDSARASLMVRSDNGPRRISRSNLNGTLLDNLNQLAEDNSDRLYRKWKIDRTNGGYPVLSSTVVTFKTIKDQSIAGEYQAVHRQWRDTVILNANGTFRRATGSDYGTWVYDGKKLILKWRRWAPETLMQKAPGEFSSTRYKFTLRRRK